MTVLFIADLHLDPQRPGITRLFEDYLASEEMRRACALYILGDLFEAWIGDDDDDELADRVAAALRQAAQRGTPLYFMPGNRDFLLGADYAERAGLERLEDGVVHEIGGVPTLLMHGDVLCTDDHAYQAIRRQLRDPAWQAKTLALPLPIRRQLAQQARADSRAHTGSSNEAIMDVNPQAVAMTMREAGVTRLIHGHTHRPAVHAFELAGQSAQRIVLGDWYEQGSVLKVDRREVALQQLGPVWADHRRMR